MYGLILYLVTYKTTMKKDWIKHSLEHINKGDIILHPADTVWSLACDPFDFNAIQQLFSIKKRDTAKSFILLVSDIEMLKTYVKCSDDVLDKIQSYIKPTTIIYKETKQLPDHLLRKEDKSIAIRLVQKDCFVKDLITTWGKPLISTSVNMSGETAPNELSQIDETILKGVDYIVDLQSEIEVDAVPSSILKLIDSSTFEIIRA